jgi:hypothetical protein
MAVSAASRSVVRRWGPGTAAIVRLLIASEIPLTQVGLAAAAGVTQPRASQVLRQLAEAGAVRATPDGYVGRPARLLELYARRARPHLAEPETYWYSTSDLRAQAHRLAQAAKRAHRPVAFSADLGPDLVAPWRHPTLTILYTAEGFDPAAAGMVPAEGRGDATIVRRGTNDRNLLSPAPAWPAELDGIPLVDPVQQWWDLLDLGGDDRREAAQRLRRAILDRTITATA